MDNFITWEMLVGYTTFVCIVYMVVEFIKELPIFKKIPTKYFSALTSLVLLIITNIVLGTFRAQDVVLYILSSISISLGANGLSTFNKDKEV